MTESQSVDVPVDLMEAYWAATAEALRAQSAMKTLRALIETLMGDAEYAVTNGEPVIRWAHVKNRRLDTTKLRESVDPVILAGCYVEGVERRFISIRSKAAKP